MSTPTSDAVQTSTPPNHQPRTAIVCLPAGETADWFSASEYLDWHNLPAGTPNPIFPVRRRKILGWITRWSTKDLIGTIHRHGAVTHAAGGRRGRLDLNTLVHQTAAVANYRWKIWSHVVRYTQAATPISDFIAQHTTNPDKISHEEAIRRFETQPRVLAMLAYTGRTVSRINLDPYELEAYQAGEATYTALHWQQAVCGDLLMTEDGRLLQPVTPTLASKLKYLAEASEYLYRFNRHQHLIAVKIDEPI
jgi:hypothetical protein